MKKLNFYLALLLVFWIPLFKPFQIPILILWGISWLLEGNYRDRFTFYKTNRWLYLLPLLYFIHLISMLYTHNTSDGWFDLQVKLSFLILPFLLGKTNELITENFDKILFAFIAGNLLASLICLANAYNDSWLIINDTKVFHTQTRDESFFSSLLSGCNQFMSSELSIIHHPGYFSLFINFAVASILFLFYQKNSIVLRFRFLFIGLLLFFGLMIFLLFSRSGMITYAVLIISYIFYRFIYDRKRSLIVVAIALLGIILLLFQKNPRIRTLQVAVGISEKTAEDSLIYKGERVFLWNMAFAVIKENPLLGCGTGDVKDRLLEKYRENQALEATEQKLNVHNQFLETWAGTGLAGFIVLNLLFLIPLYQSLRRRFFIFSQFIGIFLIFLSFESGFNTQAGVLFFTIFYPLLYALMLNRDITPSSVPQ